MSAVKKKLIYSVLTFIIGTIVSLFLSTTIHLMLLGRTKSPQLVGFFQCLNSVSSDSRNLNIFLMLEGVIIMLVMIIVLIKRDDYKPKLITITPQIEIPARAGQNQHGSARFLNEKEKRKEFDIFSLNEEDIKNLIEMMEGEEVK